MAQTPSPSAPPSSHKVAAIVLGAGMGTRMRSTLPKVMHPLAGRPMVKHLIATVESLSPERVVVVVGPDMEVVSKAVAPHATVEQTDRLGTAHAVKQAREALAGFDGDVLILYGDTPLLTEETLRAMLAARRGAEDPAVVVLGFRPEDAGEYGRLILGRGNSLEAIVEFKDASPSQRGVNLCNSGVMAVDGKLLFSLIDMVGNNNAKGEYYLTDIVALARAQGRNCSYVEGSPDELLGVNSRIEQAQAEAIVQTRLRQKAMEGGATLIDPASVWFSWDTKVGRDVTIGPSVVFGPGVEVKDGAVIQAFCHFTDAVIGEDTTVGPFARLRPGAVLEREAHVGNFVEIKKAVVEEGAKVNHLTYIGDARVGRKANVGAGTITCNYDGFNKSFTDIGEGAFIGSNTSLVAPVKIGKGAITGAGSVVAKDVPDDAIVVERAEVKMIEGAAEVFRERKRAIKARQKKD